MVYAVLKIALFLFSSTTFAVECPKCKPEEIKKVDVHKHCTESMNVTSSVALFPTNHGYSLLPRCLNCSLTLQAPEGHQLTATVYNMGLYNRNDSSCPLSKLQIFDGESTDNDTSLTNGTGLCGCKLPNTVFRSSSTSLTFLLTTTCSKDTTLIYGQFDIVVSAFRPDNGTSPLCPGEFQCRNRVCVDKNDVCNKRNDCGDNSDELDCGSPKLPRTWLIVLIILGVVCCLFLIIIIGFLIHSCCADRRGYSRI